VRDCIVVATITKKDLFKALLVCKEYFVDGINDHHGDPEVQEVAPTKDPIEDATLDDVEFIDEDANEPQLPVQKAKKGQQQHLTKIKSILGKAIKDISRAVLQKFCIHNNVLTLD
jgi:hypothetical protein